MSLRFINWKSVAYMWMNGWSYLLSFPLLRSMTDTCHFFCLPVKRTEAPHIPQLPLLSSVTHWHFFKRSNGTEWSKSYFLLHFDWLYFTVFIHNIKSFCIFYCKCLSYFSYLFYIYMASYPWYRSNIFIWIYVCKRYIITNLIENSRFFYQSLFKSYVLTYVTLTFRSM